MKKQLRKISLIHLKCWFVKNISAKVFTVLSIAKITVHLHVLSWYGMVFVRSNQSDQESNTNGKCFSKPIRQSLGLKQNYRVVLFLLYFCMRVRIALAACACSISWQPEQVRILLEAWPPYSGWSRRVRSDASDVTRPRIDRRTGDTCTRSGEWT